MEASGCLWVCVEAQRLKGSWTWYEAFIPHVSSIKPKSNSEKQQVWPPVLKRHQRSTATSSEKQRPHRSLTTYLLPGQYKCNHTCTQKFRWRWRRMQHRIAQKYQYSTQLCLQLEAAAIWHPTNTAMCTQPAERTLHPQRKERLKAALPTNQEWPKLSTTY